MLRQNTSSTRSPRWYIIVHTMGFIVDRQVADFGGTLSLFLGVSFFTILDNLHLGTKVLRSVFVEKPGNSEQLAGEQKTAWE